MGRICTRSKVTWCLSLHTLSIDLSNEKNYHTFHLVPILASWGLLHDQEESSQLRSCLTAWHRTELSCCESHSGWSWTKQNQKLHYPEIKDQQTNMQRKYVLEGMLIRGGHVNHLNTVIILYWHIADLHVYLYCESAESICLPVWWNNYN